MAVSVSCLTARCFGVLQCTMERGCGEKAPRNEVHWGKMGSQGSGKVVAEVARCCGRKILGFWGAAGRLVLGVRLWGCRPDSPESADSCRLFSESTPRCRLLASLWLNSDFFSPFPRPLHLGRGFEPADRQEHATGDLRGDSGGAAARQGGGDVRQDRRHGALPPQGGYAAGRGLLASWGGQARVRRL